MQYKLLTNKGTRELNEDYVGMTQRDGRFLFVLADGLGGHGRGDIASKLVVEQLIQFYMASVVIPELEECIEYTQEKLLQKQKQERDTGGMKTTIVILEIAEDRVRWGHVGDSRLYAFSKNKVIARTLDHSVPQMLVATGEIKEKDIRGHEDRNRLLRVMGTEWNKKMYELTQWFPLKNYQAFLLCSDGFWELLEEKYMERSLKKASSVEEWLSLMEAIVVKKGKNKEMDNYSAIVVLLEEGTV